MDRNVTFLRQEHLVLLAGLQVEITHLRRRCHELSCELDSRFPGRTTAEEEAELSARCEAAERLLEDQHGMMLAARGALRAGRARASALGRSLREEERHFLEELKRRSHQITLLSRELQRQNHTTSDLCHQLHLARLKLLQRSAASEDVEEVEEEEDEEEEDEEGDSWLLSPPAPASPAESEDGRRRVLREQRVRACVPLERVTSPQAPLPMPDPALFLVPLRYRLLGWNQRAPQEEEQEEQEEQEEETPDEWEDVEEGGGVHRRVDLGAGEGETAL